jgi:hypothetical protein
VRRVGFELEFSGLTLDDTAEALRRALGGEVCVRTAAERVLAVGKIGDFKVELDWDFLKRNAAESAETEDTEKWLDALSQAAAVLVPVEVVCPPIAMSELGQLQPMVDALREAGAVGTEETLLAAYGVHINPEIPSLDAATLFSYITAFALLQWWLVDAHDVDTARKISPYIDLYAETYLKKVLSRSAPSIDDIFSDYLEYNASRNRALDLLPLLAHIDEPRVRRAVDDPKIKPRPTFHYRLPNCHIEKADWSLASSWNKWWVVEELAHRSSDLESLKRAFFEADRPILGVSRGDWVEHIDRWLKDRRLA